MTKAVTLIVFPGFQLLDVAGPTAAFEIAERFAPGSYKLALRAPGGGAVRSSSGVSLDALPIGRSAADTVVVAGGDIAQSMSALREIVAGSGGDREDPRAPRRESGRSPSSPATAVPGTARAVIALRRFPQSGSSIRLAAVDSRPRQGIGCAQRATRSGSRRRRAGFGGEDAAAAVISAAEAGLADPCRRFSSPWVHSCRPTQRRARRFLISDDPQLR